MPTQIKCPNCATEFDIENVLSIELEQKYKKEFQQKLSNSLQEVDIEKKKLDQEQKEFEEKKKNTNELFIARIAKEKEIIRQEERQQLTKNITTDFENKVKLLEENNANNEEKLKEARKKELAFLQEKQALANEKDQLQITLQKQLLAEREKLKEQVQKDEAEKALLKDQENLMKVKELEKKLEDQNKLVVEMQRKAAQGSMQLQGEVQEILLEELLKNTFVYDDIVEVGKGIRGADCIQIIKNQFGQEAGKIIYESKRTKDFGGDWIEKLKVDMRTLHADIAIIVTQTLPKDMDRFGEKDGVYICTFVEVKSVALLLRNALLKIFEAKKSEDNKGDKMVMLYNYLISNEFSGQWSGMIDGFRGLRSMLIKEREDFEKNWKKKEKQIDLIIQNSLQISGSIEGISGTDGVNFRLLDSNE